MPPPRLFACLLLGLAQPLRGADTVPNNFAFQPVDLSGRKVVTWRDSIAGPPPLPHFEFLSGGNSVVVNGPATFTAAGADFTPLVGWEIRDNSANNISADQIRISNAGDGQGWATVRLSKWQDAFSSETNDTTRTLLATEYFTVHVGRPADPPALVAASLDPTFAATPPDPMTGHFTQTEISYTVEADPVTPNPAEDDRDTFGLFGLPAGADFRIEVASQSFRPFAQTLDENELLLDEAIAAAIADPVGGGPLPGGTAVIDGQVNPDGSINLRITGGDTPNYADSHSSAGIYTFTLTILDEVSPAVVSGLLPEAAVRVWSDPTIGALNGSSNVDIGGDTYVTGALAMRSPISFDRLYLGSGIVAPGAGGGIAPPGGGGNIVAPGAGGGIVAPGAGGGIVGAGGGAGIVAPGAGGGLVAGAGIVAPGAGGGIVGPGAGIVSPLLDAYGIVAPGAGIVAPGAGGGIVAPGAGAGIVAPGAGGGFVVISGIVAPGAGGGIVGAGAGGGIVAPGAGAGIVTPGAGAGLTSMIDVQRATLVTNAAPISIPAGPTIETGDGGAVTGVGGWLQGIASFVSSLVFQGPGANLVNPSAPSIPLGSFGIFSPGFSPGGITVEGDLALLAETRHEVEIAGRVPGVNHDFCEIVESASGNGGHFLLHGGPTLAVKLLDGFTPGPSESFAVVRADHPVSGAYGNVPSGGRVATETNGGTFLVAYSGNEVILSDYQPNPDSTYEFWSSARFSGPELADPLVSGAEADPDGDGRPNLEEFAQGTSPTAADAGAGPSIGVVPGEFFLSFTRNLFPSDLVYHLEVSPDLIRWEPHPGALLGTNGLIETWEARGPLDAAGRFFRLRLHKP